MQTASKIDPKKLLGFKLEPQVAAKNDTNVKTGAKIGKTPSGGSVTGAKVGKQPRAVMGAKIGKRPDA